MACDVLIVMRMLTPKDMQAVGDDNGEDFFESKYVDYAEKHDYYKRCKLLEAALKSPVFPACGCHIIVQLMLSENDGPTNHKPVLQVDEDNNLLVHIYKDQLNTFFDSRRVRNCLEPVMGMQCLTFSFLKCSHQWT